jgi:hypothetical protein
MLEGISSRWLGSCGVQIEAPSRQLLIDRELEVEVTKKSSATEQLRVRAQRSEQEFHHES